MSIAWSAAARVSVGYARSPRMSVANGLTGTMW
jgi:hypothetical protein